MCPGKKLGKILIDELLKMGTTFFTVYIVENCEETFYLLIFARIYKDGKNN